MVPHRPKISKQQILNWPDFLYLPKWMCGHQIPTEGPTASATTAQVCGCCQKGGGGGLASKCDTMIHPKFAKAHIENYEMVLKYDKICMFCDSALRFYGNRLIVVDC